MAKVDEFLRSDAFDDSQREDDDELDRRPSPPPKVEEAIDLTFDGTRACQPRGVCRSPLTRTLSSGDSHIN